MYPACFYKKKNYAAVLYEQHDKPEAKLKMRGVCAVRNDWSLLCKNAATQVLKIGIQQNNPQGAIDYLRGIVQKMLKHELPISDFVISKQLHDLHPKTVSPHVALCQRLQRTAPMDVPSLGSKVEFVIIKGYKELSDASRRPQDVTVEDLDINYYFERQLLKPLTELVGPLCGHAGQQTLRRLLVNDRNKQGTILAAFGRSSQTATTDNSSKKENIVSDVELTSQHGILETVGTELETKVELPGDALRLPVKKQQQSMKQAFAITDATTTPLSRATSKKVARTNTTSSSNKKQKTVETFFKT